MSRVLIAVFSGLDQSKYGYRREMVRRTYLPILREMGHHIRFVFSKPERTNQLPGDYRDEDCIVLEGFPESYAGLPRKTQAVFRWAAAAPECLLLAKWDDDTLVIPERFQAFLDALPPTVQYTGLNVGTPIQPHLEPYASGGAGYFCRRWAIQVVARAEMPENGYEDLEVGRALTRMGVRFHPDPRFSPWPTFPVPPPMKDNDTIAAHALPTSQWWASWDSCRS